MISSRPYVTVLKDLEKSRQSIHAEVVRLQKELTEVDSLIAGLRKRLLNPASQDQSAVTADNQAVMKSASAPFAGMSMRWAILQLLGKPNGSGMPVAAVADALREGGFPNPEKIRSNAGAVLSRLVAIGEVVNNGNSYALTENGREALANINLPSLVSGESAEGESEEYSNRENTEGV